MFGLLIIVSVFFQILLSYISVVGASIGESWRVIMYANSCLNLKFYCGYFDGWIPVSLKRCTVSIIIWYVGRLLLFVDMGSEDVWVLMDVMANMFVSMEEIFLCGKLLSHQCYFQFLFQVVIQMIQFCRWICCCY